jgi:4-azaleucine resistance transporter AzlC
MSESPASSVAASGEVRSAALDGVRDIMPAVIATIPFGLVFGALSLQAGLKLAESVGMSALTSAASAQFVALQLWVHPLPFWAIVLSVAAVNIRHILYGAALGRKLQHWPVPTRYLAFALLTDTTYALAELRPGPRLSAAYYFGMGVPIYLVWIATTWLGFVFGAVIRDPNALGFDFILTAYFIFLIAGFRRRRNALPVIAASAAGSVAAYLALGSPWHFAGGALAGIAVAILLAGRKGAA